MRMNLKGIPNSLFARIALIVLAGLLVSQLASFWLQSGERTEVLSQIRGQNFAERIAETVRILEAAPPQQRQATIHALQSDSLQISPLRPEDVSPIVPRGQMQSMMAQRLGSMREMRGAGSMGGMGAGMGRGWQAGTSAGVSAPAMTTMPSMSRNATQRSFDIRLADGQWYRITASAEPVSAALPRELMIRLLITLAIVLGAVMMAVGQISRPLKQLATAADTLGHDLDVPPLPEHGSIEVRQAAQAFNRMQSRLRHLLEERARALAAVSHDLRTPLTRLRLRAELVEDETLRNQLGNDLDAMALMLDTTLEYLRSLKESEKPCRIDMNAMLQSLTDDFVTIGRDVTLTGMADKPFTGRLTALRRAIQNLVDNAIKYGHRAHIHMLDAKDILKIVVEDEGPGIPEAELPRVTEPYYRPDVARSSATGGVGLGLSIVKDIAVLHGGELLLQNRPEGGLRATLQLPRD